MTWKATEQELDLVPVTPSFAVVSLPPLPAFEPRDVCMWTTSFDTILHLYHSSRGPETKVCHQEASAAHTAWPFVLIHIFPAAVWSSLQRRQHRD